MNKEQLKIELRELELRHSKEKTDIYKKYIDANNPYKVGDKFTDHIGTILIDDIRHCLVLSSLGAIYFGLELKKDGTPKKSLAKRYAYQSNGVNES